MQLDLEAVIREHASFVWRVLRHLGVPSDQLDDLSQEVFLIVVRRLDGFEGHSQLSTWLFGVCRNVARQARRTRVRHPEELTAQPPETAAPEAQSRALERSRAWACVQAALQQLPEQQRMVFVLFELQQLDMAVVARTVGCGVSTAYSRLYAAREQVRAALERAGLIEPEQDLAEVV